MPSFCPGSAKISLPNVLQTVFSSEVAPQLRNPLMRPLNRACLSLPRHHLLGRRTVTTVPIDSIPVPSAQKPKTPAITQDEPSATTTTTTTSSDKPDASNKSSNKKFSTKAKTSAKGSNFAHRTKPESKSINKKKTGDRDYKKDSKKSAKKTSTSTGPKPPRRLEEWEIHKEALKKKFPNGWAPLKKLSPDAMEGIRHLHHIAPDQFTTAVLAEEFKVSPEAIRRILKSKWRPSGEELEERRKRWEQRHDRIWSHMAELGLRPKLPDYQGDPEKMLYKRKPSQVSSESS
ncbi:mitochondrial ribosome assembly protein RRG9 [Aspergillus mulundensis]|uniref:Required for respiratory growth protein 9, mitochondrial n=1 Tax=Aspergillus mulundensis TaxID=1810919 RepID=A0A3D8SVW4_9EURO|nr:Required for respiratory growth protein 9, mitochondrial [Aspergillus mulundensis]RDW90399.1 Required for respiratory growth protein 9, mitochondrial [Aspergillus mulundensis]